MLLESRNNVSLTNLTLTDADYVSVGFQDGFNTLFVLRVTALRGTPHSLQTALPSIDLIYFSSLLYPCRTILSSSCRWNSLGSPKDAAIRISNSTDVTIQRCTFTNLGGGGVRVGNWSSNIMVN